MAEGLRPCRHVRGKNEVFPIPRVSLLRPRGIAPLGNDTSSIVEKTCSASFRSVLGPAALRIRNDLIITGLRQGVNRVSQHFGNFFQFIFVTRVCACYGASPTVTLPVPASFLRRNFTVTDCPILRPLSTRLKSSSLLIVASLMPTITSPAVMPWFAAGLF